MSIIAPQPPSPTHPHPHPPTHPPTHTHTHTHTHTLIHSYMYTSSQVCKERIRVLEFMRDYDKLRSGRIPVTTFRRALDLCGFELTPVEVIALEKRYMYSGFLNTMTKSYMTWIVLSLKITSTTTHIAGD